MTYASSSVPLPPVAEVGTPAYFQSLLAYIRAAHPALPLDPVILQSLLLCLIARIPASSALALSNMQALGDAAAHSMGESHLGPCMNLILRTREEDVAMLVHLVSLTLTTVFGIATHKHKVIPKATTAKNVNLHSSRRNTSETPDEFLRALFFRRPTASNSARLSTDMTPRTAPRQLYSPSHANSHSLSQTPRPSPLRLAQSIDREQTDDAPTDYFIDGASLASSRRPLMSGSTPSSTLRSRRTRADPRRSEPLSLGLSLDAFALPDEVSIVSPGSVESKIESRREAPLADDVEKEDLRSLAVLPQAVVVSGLEHATLPLQRALLQVLSERRLVLEEDSSAMYEERRSDGTWNLPDEFIAVYVCKADPRERPTLIRGLLDKFAMSADITLSSSLRQAYAAYRGTPTSTPHASPFATPHSLPTPSDHTPNSPLRSPPIRASLLSQCRPLTVSVSPAIAPSELAVLRALASANPSPHAHAYTVIRPSLDLYLRDLFSAARHHPMLDGTFMTRHAQRDAEALVRAYRVIAGDSVGAELVREVAVEGSRSEQASTQRSGETGSVGSREWDKDVNAVDWAVPNIDTPKQEEDNDGPDGPVRVNLTFGGARASNDTHTVDLSPLQAPVSKEVWDVSEVDIARVFPRIVSHRLKVRDGPHQEILGSVMWPAVDILPQDVLHSSGRDAWEQRTVKEILVDILADV